MALISKLRIDSAVYFSYHYDMDDNDLFDSRGKDTGTAPEKSLTFFQKLLSVFTNADGPERERKRLLKVVAKQLKNQKYKFYKPKGEEAQPILARLLYDVYKLIGPSRVFLENATESGALKAIIIENFLEDEQREIIEELSEDSIRKRAETEDLKSIAAGLKEQLVAFFSAFDSEKVKSVNSLYNLLLVFLRFIHYDYYFVLRKFDSSLPEGDLLYNPKFEAIHGNYISDDLKDFLEIIAPLETGSGWDALFDVLRVYKNQEVINRQDWSKQLKVLAGIKKSNVLLLIIRHVDKDPYFQMKVRRPSEKIVESYLSKVKTQAELTLQRISQEKRNSKIDTLAVHVFGTSAISRLKYYTEKANISFSKKMLGGFNFIEPLNYLKAFLLDFVKKDLKQVVDLFLIKGKWSTNIISQKLSDSFHGLLEVSDELVRFDESLSEEGEVGAKIKSVLPRIDRDQASLAQLKQIIRDCNEAAANMIKSGGNNLVALGKNLKTIIDDYSNQPHQLIVNWKELDAVSEGTLKKSVSDVYKKIYYFIQLIQFFSK